jgi:hypothetical protein
VRLPSQDNGPIVLPYPDDELRERGAKMMFEASKRANEKA